ncbi:TetR/AcrR family transcriptional regulator [Corynebacterium choanae]|uniref:HTH tetR-type domain-containing protein n=1 Tax=Corynebacterium choanae TaxID=1862358 RepID=A0A3G6J6S9_9CORY|nr:TetR/AcrR family transcriptional regulator [Corynebacterium choanae]AZA13666.1 hypothetical protein CCHOA_06335 [Corynebacterium choanae]
MDDQDEKRRGPKPKFSLDDAVDIALSLGLNEFSLAAVAKELGFSTPSLYRVIANRDDLVDKCLERIAQEMPLPPADQPWQEQLHFFTDALWNLLDTYPGLSKIFLTRPFSFRHAQDYIWTLVDNCQDAGFGEDRTGFSFGLMLLAEMTFVSHLHVEQRRNLNIDNPQVDPKLMEPIDRVSLTRRLFYKTDDIWLDQGNLRDRVNFVIAGIEAVRTNRLALPSTRTFIPATTKDDGEAAKPAG